MIKNIKNTVPYVIIDLNVEEIFRTSYKRKLEKRNQKHFTKKQVTKKNGDIKLYILNGKAVIILLTVGLMKKILLYKMNYFPELYTQSEN